MIRDRRSLQFIDRNAPPSLRLYDQFRYLLDGEEDEPLEPDEALEMAIEALEQAAVATGYTKRADGTWMNLKRLEERLAWERLRAEKGQGR